jgi:threonine dehydrogenase-like Zn-dependent dehydrogenase
MLALVTEPAVPHSTRVADVPEPTGDGVLLRVLEVGVCGTDREISEGLFGVPADGSSLVLGHESLAIVQRDGHGFAKGDLVTATVRRSCHHCLPCEEGAPDSCLTGDYSERGITRLDGFARELVVEDPAQLIPIPAALGRLGVLAEPTSICERAIRHARAIGDRQPWQLERALVVGAGAIGMISTYLLRLAGVEVWTASLEPSSDLVSASGARYVSTADMSLADLRAETGGFDLVVSAVPDAQVMADSLGLLRRSGVACLLGIDAVLENRVLFGSVNAHRQDWLAAVESLDRARERWPEALEAFVGRRVPLDRFQEAFDYRSGVKATLLLDD